MIATPAQPSKNGKDSSANEIWLRLRSLPPFNSTAVKLLAQPVDEEISMSAVEESLSSDPSLVGQLLVAANSALFGQRTQVATIRQALFVVGLDRLRAMVATVATSAYMRTLSPEAVRPIWAHGVATAVIAEHLAKYSDKVSGSLMYTAGLVHDLGRLGMMASESEAYKAFLFAEHPDLEESEHREKALFGMTHTVAGDFLMRTWGFPETLCRQARNHHDDTGKDPEPEQIIQSACLLADEMGYPELRLQSAGQSSALQRWQGKCLHDSCRDLVEERVREFLK